MWAVTQQLPSEWAMPRGCCVKPCSAHGPETWKWYKERECAHGALETDELWQTCGPTLSPNLQNERKELAYGGQGILSWVLLFIRRKKKKPKRSFLLATPAPIACSSPLQTLILKVSWNTRWGYTIRRHKRWSYQICLDREGGTGGPEIFCLSS